MNITVLVIDDHPIVEQGVRNVLSDDDEFTFAGAAQTLESATQLVQSRRPDVILLDVRLGDTNAATSVRLLQAIHPPATIILFTAHPQSSDTVQAIRAGARAAIAKDTPPRRIRELVKSAISGREVHNNASRSNQVLTTNPSILTLRQLEVLERVAAGMTNSEIADELNLRPTTVKAYWQETMQRLGVRNRAAAIAIAYNEGLL